VVLDIDHTVLLEILASSTPLLILIIFVGTPEEKDIGYSTVSSSSLPSTSLIILNLIKYKEGEFSVTPLSKVTEVAEFFDNSLPL
jgi:hypothetical protein